MNTPVVKTPTRTAPCPFITDDFYDKNIDWSPKNNKILITGARYHFKDNYPTVELIDPSLSLNRCSTILVRKNSKPRIISLSWASDKIHFSIRDEKGYLDVWDVQKKKCIINFERGKERNEYAQAWNENILISGYGSGGVLQRDVRKRKTTYSYEKLPFEPKSDFVISLKWSKDKFRFVSSSNSAVIKIYDIRIPEIPIYAEKQESGSYIKGVEWSPLNPHELIIGNQGYIEKIDINQKLSVVRTYLDSRQLSDLVCIRNSDLFMVGFSDSSSSIFTVEDFKKVAELKKSKGRIICLDQNHDGSQILSVAGGSSEFQFWDTDFEKAATMDSLEA